MIIEDILKGKISTRRELEVEKRQLRRDLYYRLNVISFNIPLLRDRKDDIETLTHFFIEKYNQKLDKDVKGISQEALQVFMDYPWEGNVRELEHLIEGIMSIYDIEMIDIDELPLKIKKNSSKNIVKDMDMSLNKVLEDTEKDLIKEALRRTSGNVTHSAELLKIPRQTLQYKIGKYDL